MEINIAILTATLAPLLIQIVVGGWAVLLPLAFQSIGVVYGDIGTSQLYMFASCFPNGIKNNDDILGVLSIIFYTLTLLPLIKYVFIVLRANDNGDGGTFALYSLICRHAKINLIPNQQIENENVSNFRLELPNNGMERASKLKSKLENSNFAKYFLLFATMLGTSMLIGDGVLTPCISDRIVWASVGVLIFLFMIQRFGTDKVGYTFAPILCIWFSFIAGIGIYNFVHHDPSVAKALNPKYILDYFRRNQKQAWISLGGAILSVTVVIAYAGQASYLRKHNSDALTVFYSSIPGIAVVFVMFLTSAFLVLVMIVVWKTHILLVTAYILIIGSIELVYLSSVLYKFDQGGYLPLAFALLLMTIMFVWNYVYRKTYFFELDHKMSPENVKQIVQDTNNSRRLPGLAIFYSELVHGIPPIFNHYVANVPALHSVLIFVSFKSLPISKVPIAERFLLQRVQPNELQLFRCVVRYGYRDLHNEEEPFEGNTSWWLGRGRI
ncbi:hypothetical protein DH2020_045909 [Rehmannia glutinosa]|uniref:Potassium transporter n=1 Tax=Rehmannia glutinosa TaxID=99300 RepID=A0ABR0UCT9_REHGL